MLINYHENIQIFKDHAKLKTCFVLLHPYEIKMKPIKLIMASSLVKLEFLSALKR